MLDSDISSFKVETLKRKNNITKKNLIIIKNSSGYYQ